MAWKKAHDSKLLQLQNAMHKLAESEIKKTAQKAESMIKLSKLSRRS